MGDHSILSLVSARRSLASGEVCELRRRARLTQSELARAIGGSPAAVSRWESQARRPRGANAERLARIVELLERATQERKTDPVGSATPTGDSHARASFKSPSPASGARGPRESGSGGNFA